MKLFAFLIFISILLSGLYFIPNADGHTELSDTQILRANSDSLIAGWNRVPGTGLYYDKTFTNDTNDTYIYPGSAWSVAAFGLDDFDNPELENQSINITFWIISRNSLAFPTSYTLFGVSNSGTSASAIMYDSSTVRRAYRYTQANVWKNITITTEYCPWTNSKWTETSINQIYITLWSNALGIASITEIGAIVNVYTPVETDYNYIFLLFIVVGVIILLLLLGIITNRRKGE